MFPKNDESVPQLRFKGFDGEWKEKKIGDAFKYLLVIKIQKIKMTKDCTHFFDCSEKVEKINSYYFDGEALLIAGSGASAGKDSII